jgi:hypothetical protein
VFRQNLPAGRMDLTGHVTLFQFIKGAEDILLETDPFFLQP